MEGNFVRSETFGACEGKMRGSLYTLMQNKTLLDVAYSGNHPWYEKIPEVRLVLSDQAALSQSGCC